MRTKQISPDANGFVSFNLILMYLLALEYKDSVVSAELEIDI